MNIKEAFDKFQDEFLMFELVENKLNSRQDLHAFILLDSLVPSPDGIDMISCAEHDQIYLGVDPEELAKVATEDDILDLARCGVMYDNETDSLSMFV